MISLAAYPACERYLRSMRVDMTQKGMNAYYAALTVADNFDDEELTEAGTVNFWTMDGDQCLAGVEAFLIQRRPTASKYSPIGGIERKDLDSLRAMIGVYHIETRRFDEYSFWKTACQLWPDHIVRGERDTLTSLLRQIKAIPKKQRSALARANAKKARGHH
jgi:hypothetical protein